MIRLCHAIENARNPELISYYANPVDHCMLPLYVIYLVLVRIMLTNQFDDVPGLFFFFAIFQCWCSESEVYFHAVPSVMSGQKQRWVSTK
jgi:hypothetical protein